MQTGIHPNYVECEIKCACGNVIETRSTQQGTIQVDLCSACHPFFTGKQKLMDTAGRIDRFKKKFGGKISSAGVPKPLKVKKQKAAPAKLTKVEAEKKEEK